MIAIWLVGGALAGDVRDEVATALATGECAAALTLSRGWAGERPTDPAAHKAVGDAQRCLGDAWEAVAAYRRAQALGGDPTIPKLIEALAKDLGRIDLTIVGGTAAAELVVADVRLLPDAATGGSLTWTAVPVGVPLEVRVAGTAPVAVAALRGGEARAIGVQVPDAAPGAIVLPGWDTPGLRVQLVQAGHAALVMAEETPAAAGAIVVRVQGRYGAVEERVALTPG